MKKIIALYKIFIVFLILTFLGLLTSLLRIISVGKLVNFNAELITPPILRLLMRLIGIRFVFEKPPKLDENVVYVFNHNSFLDIFCIPALGLRNTRFVISVWTKSILPLFLSNWGISSLFIPLTEEKKAREVFIQSLSKNLTNEEFNVVLSPEGRHKFIHGISDFNEIVFKTAILSKTNIVPIFVETPKESNPFQGLYFSGGTIRVRFLPVIETSGWKIAELRERTKFVRDIYLNEFQKWESLS